MLLVDLVDLIDSMLRGQELVPGVMSELRTERAEEKSSKNWQGKSRKIKENHGKSRKATESNWKQKVLALNWFPLVPLHHVTLVTECNTRNVLKYLKCTLQNTDHSDFMLKSGNLLRKFGTSQSTSLAETLGEFWRVQLPWRVYTNYILHYISLYYYIILCVIDTHWYWCVIDEYWCVIYLMILKYVDNLLILMIRLESMRIRRVQVGTR